ncbi:hypothetical protein GCM10022247_68510 [Allokutzneria multivorans]|uniref:Lipoprotein n=1 Tax=Allokutzneria multivorans TaxID=1142134 RepID=A0ABP7TZX5_9PSEU
MHRNLTFALVAATIALLTSCSPSRDDPPNEAKQEAVATIAWIRGEGRAAVAVHDTARSLISAEITVSSCDAAVDALDRTSTPVAVVETITKVPNADLRAALEEEQGLFRAVVSDTTRGRPSEPDAGVDQLRIVADAVTALIRHLEELAR